MAFVASLWDRQSPINGAPVEEIRSGLPLGDRGFVVLITDTTTSAVVQLQSYDPALLPDYVPMNRDRAVAVGDWWVRRLNGDTTPATAAPTSTVQALITVTSSGGVASIVWPKPFKAAPVVQLSVENDSTTMGGWADLTKGSVTATGATVRTWRALQITTLLIGVGASPVQPLAGATVHVLAYGELA